MNQQLEQLQGQIERIIFTSEETGYTVRIGMIKRAWEEQKEIREVMIFFTSS